MFKLFFRSVEEEMGEIPKDISEYRKNKILSAKRDGMKKVLIASAEVLKAGFADYGVDEKDVEYGILGNGKPVAVSHPDIHFSLSHSENMAVSVFSDTPVGVDCEKADRKVSTQLLKRFFTQEEVEAYKDDPLLLWVAGECLSKLSGEGVFVRNKRTCIPPFDGDTVTVDGVILEKKIIGDNLVVIASPKD